MSQKIGILLVQMGGPCCTANVENFLFNLFNDKHIIQLPFFLSPFQKLLARTIARKRAPEVAELYEKIGARSPILYETQLQAKGLAEKLSKRKDDNDYQVYISMRYSYPFMSDTLKDILQANLDELVVIPLYPQYSTATTESNFAECRELFAESGLDKKIPIKYIKSWEDNEYFIEAWVQRIVEAINTLSSLRAELSKAKQSIHLLFSAHGLPEKYVLKGDPYQEQVLRSVDLILANLQHNAVSETVSASLSYQSKVGPVKWLEPATDTEIERLAASGVKNLIVVPISFVGDHIETSYEINMLYRDLAIEKGIENFVMARALKDDPLLIAALEDKIQNAIFSRNMCHS
jgi:protoporphyrin/coproporphyrin ferrochelatase